MGTLFAILHVFEARPNQTERLRKRITPVFFNHNGMMTLNILLVRHITQERDIGTLLNVHAVVDGGVEHTPQKQECHGDGKAYQKTHHSGLTLVRSDRITIWISIINHLTCSLQLRAGHQ